MFVTLLAITFIISLAVSVGVAAVFSSSIKNILDRIISDNISAAWLKYMRFAIVVVGVSSGVRIYALERYITPQSWDKKAQIIELTRERWVLELYRTVIESLQGLAWMLLVFFIFALVAFVVVRIAEMKNERRA